MTMTAFFIAEDATPRERRGRSVWRFFLDRITAPVITGAILAAAAAVAIPSSAVAASIGVALVENFTGISAGVEVMQYLQTGRTIRLGPHDTIVLTYLNSCIQETITGGSVTIGIDQSEVKTGEVKRTRLNCDVGNFLLSGQGDIAIAGIPKKTAVGKHGDTGKAGLTALNPAFIIFVMGITASPNIFGHSGHFPARTRWTLTFSKW